MKIKDVNNIDDVIKYIQAKGEKSWMLTLEITQNDNWVLIQYGKIVEVKTRKELAPWHTLLLQWQVKSKPTMNYQYAKLNLCNFIEPYISKKLEYERKRNDILRPDEPKST
jgi:hypothetical protein